MSARIGVIGCGWWATRAHLPALVANPDAVIAGIADPDVENRTRAAERFGIGPDRVFADAAAMLDQAGLDGLPWPGRCSIAVSISSSRNR